MGSPYNPPLTQGFPEGFNLAYHKKEEYGGGIVAEIILNYPKTRNAFGYYTTASFRNCLKSLNEMLKTNPKMAVIIRSVVPGVFCAGADLKERLEMKNEEHVAKWVHGFRELLEMLENIPAPTIAAMDAKAVGGGLELGLACDIRIASEEAEFGLLETNLGIIPGGGGTQRLPRLVGIAKAKELIFTGRLINGKEGEKIGLINEAVKTIKTDSAYKRAFELAEEILKKSAPLAISAAKLAINKGVGLDIKEGLELERYCYDALIPTNDRLEGLAAFKEKRTPRYLGK